MDYSELVLSSLSGFGEAHKVGLLNCGSGGDWLFEVGKESEPMVEVEAKNKSPADKSPGWNVVPFLPS